DREVRLGRAHPDHEGEAPRAGLAEIAALGPLELAHVLQDGGVDHPAVSPVVLERGAGRLAEPLHVPVAGYTAHPVEGDARASSGRSATASARHGCGGGGGLHHVAPRTYPHRPSELRTRDDRMRRGAGSTDAGLGARRRRLAPLALIAASVVALGAAFTAVPRA